MIEEVSGCWKIENEGFNNQKNGIYDIEHFEQQRYKCDEESLSPDADGRYLMSVDKCLKNALNGGKIKQERFSGTGRFDL